MKSLISVFFGMLVLSVNALAADAAPLTARHAIDSIRFQLRTGLATHRTYLGSCDGGMARVTSYKVPGYVQIDEITVNNRGYAKLFAAVREDRKSEFVLLNVNGEEIHLTDVLVLRYLMNTLPNLHAMYVNNMVSGGTDPDILRENKVVPTRATFPLRSDCSLNENDKLPVEKWEKLPN